MKTIFYTLFISTFLYSCSCGEKKACQSDDTSKPLNVILLIGDGMGHSEMSSAFYFGDTEPNFAKFPIVGLAKTSSKTHKITDSAAAGTALATGKKTYNGAIGVDIDSITIVNITEKLSLKGIKTGVIASSAVTHATPAAFYAHVPARGMEYEIAKQLTSSDIDFFAGGGIGKFVRRPDKVDYLSKLAEAGFVVDTTSLDMSTQYDSSKKYGYLLADNGMPRMLDGRGDFLPNATQKGIEYLSANKEGFFLMVEGSQIDWGGHANNSEYIITETLDFDKAVGVALDFAKKDGNTLVIVTADHETGGYALSAKGHDYKEIDPAFAATTHSATLVPVLIYGPGSDKFNGIYENTQIPLSILNVIK